MTKQERFISVIEPLAFAEYMNRDRWVLPSVCIAQGALESGWNAEAKTLFGIKGKGNNLKTVEYINGKYESVAASFRAYPTIAAAVHGYYDLITNNIRYSGAVNNHDAIDTVRKISAGGYATDPDYANKVISIIRNYNLTKYDIRETDIDTREKTLDKIVRKVIRGDYGNGEERKKRLKADGYDPEEVQKRVNKKLKG